MRRLFYSNDEFWLSVYSRLDLKRTLNIYCHNAAFDLTITDFWKRSQREKWTIDFAVLESPPVIISVSTPKGRFNLIDTLNYFKVPLKVLGDSVGLPKLDMPKEAEKSKDWEAYCYRDTEIIAESMYRLIRFVKDNKLGKLGSTVASLALSAYRHRFMSIPIKIHDRKKVLDLEQQSYHGGLVNCLYVGKVKRKWIYKLDVNSLYPFVMLNKYPTELAYELRSPTLSAIKTTRYGIIANVRIKTSNLIFPTSSSKTGEFIMPIGQYNAVLCGPELARALINDCIVSCSYAAFYHLEHIFTDYVMYFWGLRKKYKSQGDKANETFCKYMLNSLYGKFAQGHYSWVSANIENVRTALLSIGSNLPDGYDSTDDIPKIKRGQREWLLLDGLPSVKLRRIGDYQQCQIRDGVHSESFVAIASFVTSYARRYLLELIACCGPKHCYYYDTDSVFVDSLGKNNLEKAGYVSNTELGKLKLEGREYEPTFLAPKDYMFGGDICLKGIRKNAVAKGNGVYEQDKFEGLPSIIKRGGEAYILIERIKKRVTHRYKKGMVEKDGWTKPFELH